MSEIRIGWRVVPLGAVTWAMACAIALAPAAADDAGDAEAAEALVKEIMELSGWTRQIEQLPPVVEESLARQQNEDQLSPEARRVIRQFVTQAFHPALIYRHTVKAILGRGADLERLEATKRLLQNPLSRRMTELELAAGGVEGQRRMREYAATLSENLPSEARKSVMEKLDTVTAGTEFATEMVALITMGVIRASDAAKPPGARADPRQLAIYMQQLRPRLSTQMRGLVLISNLFTYRSASDEEVRDYIDLLASRTGQWLVSTLTRSFLEALSRAADVAVEGIGSQMEI
ncbi:MAG: hypothetical protein O7D96_00455 [SAR324 cluster bacterium]|nr:hypothetical protein [SAR324 cluster bacterium]